MTEPDTPAGPRLAAVMTLVIAVGMAALDSSIANTALPSIAADLDATSSACCSAKVKSPGRFSGRTTAHESTTSPRRLARSVPSVRGGVTRRSPGASSSAVPACRQ